MFPACQKKKKKPHRIPLAQAQIRLDVVCRKDESQNIESKFNESVKCLEGEIYRNT